MRTIGYRFLFKTRNGKRFLMTILPVFFGAKTTEKVGWKVVLKRLKLRNMTAIEREQQTIKIMIGIYCHDHHHPSDELCAECNNWLIMPSCACRNVRLHRINPHVKHVLSIVINLRNVNACGKSCDMPARE